MSWDNPSRVIDLYPINSHERLMRKAFNRTARNVAILIFCLLAIGFVLGFVTATLI
jgi:hypothetical protein